MLQEIARLLGGVPGVTISLRIQVDPNATTEEATYYRGLMIVGCDHAAAKEAFQTKMKAKNMTPIPLTGTADEIERDIMSGKILGRLQERLVLAKEAETENPAGTKTAAPAKAPKAAATGKAAAAKPAKTAEELKAIGSKVSSQTSLLDQGDEAEEKPKTEVAKPVAEAKMKAPVTTPPAKNKKVQQFVDLVEELSFAINGSNKKQAEEKLRAINALGKELNEMKVFAEGKDSFSREALDTYNSFKALKPKVAEMPEDDNDAAVFESDDQDTATFED